MSFYAHYRSIITNASDNCGNLAVYGVKLQRRDGRTEGQTPETEFGAFLPYNVTFGDNNFNDFPDNQLTKFRVFIR